MAGNEIASMELPAPAGWKKFIPKDGTPKRNGVIFISPSGEEIRNRKHMDQFLRSHPGGPSPSEFDWGYGDKPRRSVRIREKFKATESPDGDPPVKKQRKLNLGEEKQEMNGEDAEEQEEQGEGKQESNGEDTEEQEEEGEGKLKRNDVEEQGEGKHERNGEDAEGQEEQGEGKQESNDAEEQSVGNQKINGEDTKEQEEQVDEVPEGKKTDSQAVESIIVDVVMEEGEGNQVSEGTETDSRAVESIIVDVVIDKGEGKQERNSEDTEELEEQGEGKQESDGEDAEEHEKQGEGKQERNDTKEQGEGNQEMNGEDTEEQEEQVDEVPEDMKTDSIAVESIIVDAVMKDIEDGSAEAKEENNFTELVAEDKTTAERVVTVEDADQYSGEILVRKDQNGLKILEIEETSKDLPVLSPPEAADEDNSVLRESKEKLEVESVPEENSAVKEIQVASEVAPHETEFN